MLLYIIRHGDPDYKNDCLTEKGRAQAAALAKRLAVHGLDRVYSSPMGRARQTAQPACDLLGLPLQIEDWTAENAAWDELAARHPDGRFTWAFHAQNTLFRQESTRRREDWFNIEPFPPTSRKGYERIRQHSDGFIARLGYVREGSLYRIERPSRERVAVFCHQGFGTTWMSHLLDVPPQIFWAGFDVTHSSVTILLFRDNPDGWTAPMCLCLSDTSHIYKEGLPLQHNNEIDI
ncbi:MAG: histidine phosphatase family protein [Oscillospiraceae bacterium]|jgi:probable phosphoglycerate mutase|nr:histidine phosphatase family protein [Oscillospiraceae bacterium]